MRVRFFAEDNKRRQEIASTTFDSCLNWRPAAFLIE
jgi:hypothetical protein